jgi:hypothetical protein
MAGLSELSHCKMVHTLDTNIRLEHKWLTLPKPQCYSFNYGCEKVLSHGPTGFSELSHCKMVHT